MFELHGQQYKVLFCFYNSPKNLHYKSVNFHFIFQSAISFRSVVVFFFHIDRLTFLFLVQDVIPGPLPTQSWHWANWYFSVNNSSQLRDLASSVTDVPLNNPSTSASLIACHENTTVFPQFSRCLLRLIPSKYPSHTDLLVQSSGISFFFFFFRISLQLSWTHNEKKRIFHCTQTGGDIRHQTAK